MISFTNTRKKYFKQKKTKRQYRYLHIIQTNKTGETRWMKIHKAIPVAVLCGLISSMLGVGGLLIQNISLREALIQTKAQSQPGNAVKKDMAALTQKIRHIENTVSELKTLSTSLKNVAYHMDDRKNTQQKYKTLSYHGGDTLGIGPLTQEEFEISKHLSDIKEQHFLLKTLFEEAEKSQKESSDSLIQFNNLIAELKHRHEKLQQVPDVAPTRGRLSSSFGWRLSPFTGKGRMHMGLDIAAPIGSPIYATAEGVVTRTAIGDGYGRMLEIKHANKLLTRYAHTSMIYVAPGEHVKKGQVIAAVGSTGRSTGPHVHYEIEVEGAKIDPRKYIALW